MSRERLFNILAGLIFSLFLVNSAAVKLYWYYSIWWFDMPMHFWGGLCAGMLVLWFLAQRALPKPSFSFFWKIILGVLCIGLLWEIFEFLFNNVIAGTPFDFLDTASDLLFDLLGGAAVFLFLAGKVRGKEPDTI